MTLQDITEQQLKTVQTILENQRYDYSCAMALLPAHIVDQVSKLWADIDPSLLVEKGIEKDPHITILYGIHDQSSAPVERILKGTGPWNASLTSLSLFKHPDFDVLKLGVKSEDLNHYNEELRANLPYTNSYPDYKPHLTIAYLKPGTGERFVKPTELDGTIFSINEVEFSPSEGDKVIFSITDITEDAPANNVGGGHIAGVGIGPQGEPGVRKKRTKYTWNHGRENS